jgi:hypothetical protein
MYFVWSFWVSIGGFVSTAGLLGILGFPEQELEGISLFVVLLPFAITVAAAYVWLIPLGIIANRLGRRYIPTGSRQIDF